jgi:hypothetical protein
MLPMAINEKSVRCHWGTTKLQDLRLTLLSCFWAAPKSMFLIILEPRSAVLCASEH